MNKISILFCFVIVALGIALHLTSTPLVAEQSLVDVIPAHISEDRTFHATYVFRAIAPRMLLEFSTTVPIEIEYNGQKYLPTNSQYKGNERAFSCRRVGDFYNYSIIFIPKSSRATVSIRVPEGGGEGTITNFLGKVVKYKHTTSLSGLSSRAIIIFAGVGGILLSLGFLVRATYPIPVQWAWIFYSFAILFSCEPGFATVLILFLLVAYLLRRRLGDSRGASRFLFLFVGASVFFLVLFKYFKAAIYASLNEPSGFSILMPLGISYFIIRLIDTQLGWFRKQNLNVTYREFMYYMLFPGTLVAGPIETIQSFTAGCIAKIDRQDVAQALGRILIGVFKKIVIVDAILYQAIHGMRFGRYLWLNSEASVNKLIIAPTQASGDEIMAFAISGLLFAYIDFSAYSDIAIGTSRLMGHKIRENFNFPIFAPNIRIYWQRWHISLSEWSFRNAYFPLLLKSRNSYIPLYVTMMIIGMWHVPNLSWYSWAIHHATGLSIVSWLQSKHKRQLPPLVKTCLYPVRVAATFLFVALGFIFVYFNDYTIALQLYMKAWLWLISFGAY